MNKTTQIEQLGTIDERSPMGGIVTDDMIRPRTKLELIRCWLDANFSPDGERVQSVATVRARAAYEILEGDAP